MKKKRVIIWSVITLLTIMAVLEVFDLHPRIYIGHSKVVWSGFRHMIGFTTIDGSMDGGKFKIYELGPVSIVRYV
jgi:hypothetical protein